MPTLPTAERRTIELAGLAVPFVEVTGAADGPTLTVIAGVHGCEYASMDGVRRWLRTLEDRELRGRRFYDAGVAESVPFRTPLAQGATHVLVLRSRRPLATDVAADAHPDGADGVNGSAVPRPPRSIRLLTRTTLRNESLALRTALLTRRVRTAADMTRIVAMEAEGRALMIYPPATTPPVSRLTTDSRLLAGALEAGREAARGRLVRLSPRAAAPRRRRARAAGRRRRPRVSWSRR